MGIVAKEVKAMSQADILAFEKSGEATFSGHCLKLTDIKVWSQYFNLNLVFSSTIYIVVYLYGWHHSEKMFTITHAFIPRLVHKICLVYEFIIWYLILCYIVCYDNKNYCYVQYLVIKLFGLFWLMCEKCHSYSISSSKHFGSSWGYLWCNANFTKRIYQNLRLIVNLKSTLHLFMPNS